MVDDLRWTLAHGATCAFSTVQDGDMRNALRRQAWLDRTTGSGRGAVLRQIHGADVVEADPESEPAADAMITTDPTLALVVFGADCPGLCVVAPDALGVAHCGWRGVAAGVVSALVERMAQRSRVPPSAFTALIGPGIAFSDYEVDAPVLSSRVWPAAAVRPGCAGHAWLDLHLTIAEDLRRIGVQAITTAPQRTGRDPRLRSYRLGGGPGLVQALVAWRGGSSLSQAAVGV